MREIDEPLNERFLTAVSRLDGVSIRHAIGDEPNKEKYLQTLNAIIPTSHSFEFLLQMHYLFVDHFSEKSEDRKNIIKRMIELCDTSGDCMDTLTAIEQLDPKDQEELKNSTTLKSSSLTRLLRERENTHSQLYKYMSIGTLPQFKTLEHLRAAIKNGQVVVSTSNDGVVENLRTFCDDIGAQLAVEKTDDEIEPYQKALGETPKKVTMWMVR